MAHVAQSSVIEKMREAAREIRAHLDRDIVPFWETRAIDEEHGGYFTGFDEDGLSTGTAEKYLNTQCRLLWWFSTLARRGRDPSANLARARHGYEFLCRYFLDRADGGWFWKIARDGTRIDDGKVVYGQSFAIYALSEFSIASGDADARWLANETFRDLQRHCLDSSRGGYLENMEADWTPSGPGFCAGDRKSLDTHMHLLESFTVLFELTGIPAHRDALLTVARLIRDRMIDPKTGCGRNQFDLEWNPVPAIAIRRTWNAERAGNAPATPADTTSYGHNVELAWLLRRALTIAGEDLDEWVTLMNRLVSHALEHGVDWEYGGIFRDGIADGGPTILEKEFWQNAEGLVGFLDAWHATGDSRNAAALLNVWTFAKDHFIAPCGEWRVLLDRKGNPIDRNVGNEWKVAYHVGRAALECTRRFVAAGELAS